MEYDPQGRDDQFGREARIGLLIIALLLAVFVWAAYKRFGSSFESNSRIADLSKSVIHNEKRTPRTNKEFDEKSEIELGGAPTLPTGQNGSSTSSVAGNPRTSFSSSENNTSPANNMSFGGNPRNMGSPFPAGNPRESISDETSVANTMNPPVRPPAYPANQNITPQNFASTDSGAPLIEAPSFDSVSDRPPSAGDFAPTVEVPDLTGSQYNPIDFKESNAGALPDLTPPETSSDEGVINIEIPGVEIEMGSEEGPPSLTFPSQTQSDKTTFVPNQQTPNGNSQRSFIPAKTTVAQQPRLVTNKPSLGNSQPSMPSLSMTMGTEIPRVTRVASNESFWSISQRVYGTGHYFKAIHEHNKRSFPDISVLPVGKQVVLPTLQEIERKYSRLITAEVLNALKDRIRGGDGRQIVYEEPPVSKPDLAMPSLPKPKIQPQSEFALSDTSLEKPNVVEIEDSQIPTRSIATGASGFSSPQIVKPKLSPTLVIPPATTTNSTPSRPEKNRIAQLPPANSPNTRIKQPRVINVPDALPVDRSKRSVGRNRPPAVEQVENNDGTLIGKTASSQANVYHAKGNETLFDIARSELKSAYRFKEIYDLNQASLGSNVNHLTVLPKGTQLILPKE